MNRFDSKVRLYESTEGLYAKDLKVIQVNLGLKCNLECRHCHVVSSPRRTEMMSWETMEYILSAVKQAHPRIIDLTGGAPEMNPHYRRFVSALKELGVEIIVRTNLTIMLETGYEDLPEFNRDHEVHLVASLPCYTEENVDRQRGEGVFAKSIRVLRRLNELGYGIVPNLPLDLVFNPGGPTLPGNQADLERDYKRILDEVYGISFTHLLTITNMPIGRFWGDLKKKGCAETYRNLLYQSFNPATLDELMCRHQVNVRWDGTLFDCDFNLALRMPLEKGIPSHIKDFQADTLARRRIVTADHCFGCTAGQGSSCGGALVDNSVEETGI